MRWDFYSKIDPAVWAWGQTTRHFPVISSCSHRNPERSLAPLGRDNGQAWFPPRSSIWGLRGVQELRRRQSTGEGGLGEPPWSSRSGHLWQYGWKPAHGGAAPQAPLRVSADTCPHADLPSGLAWEGGCLLGLYFDTEPPQAVCIKSPRKRSVVWTDLIPVLTLFLTAVWPWAGYSTSLSPCMWEMGIIIEPNFYRCCEDCMV